MDVEENLPAEIQITQYFLLFVSDFLFTFICCFCSYDSNKNKFTSNFKNFDNFFVFCLNYLSRKCMNIISILELAEKKIKYFELDCEKTEYVVSDRINTYGIYFLVLQAINFQFNEKINNEFEESLKLFINTSPYKFIPEIYSREFLSKVILKILTSIISIENNSEKISCKFFIYLVEGFLKIILDKILNKTIEINKSKNVQNFTNDNSLNKKNEIVLTHYSNHLSRFLIGYFEIREEKLKNQLILSYLDLFKVFL